MDAFLNSSFCTDLRNVINSTPIFEDDEYREHYNLFCAVMDRLDSCILYLNHHAQSPKNERDFLVFFLFGCMVVDGVRKILEELDLEYNYSEEENEGNFRYFKNAYLDLPFDKEKCPTDDKFFEYLRSLVFAHPFDTNRPKFFQKGEVQYSPWVIPNNEILKLKGFNDTIGIRIYSNKNDEIIHLYFPFITLKNYIKSRYKLLQQATDWVKEKKSEKEHLWKLRNVNRKLFPVDILKDVADILASRFEPNYEIDRAIIYMECETTLHDNDASVSKFREAIIAIIPNLCDAVDKLDNNTIIESLNNVLNVRPRKMHQMANYQLEKIFNYLNDRQNEGNKKWGLYQAKCFGNMFAKHWVTIKIDTMSFDEIKLLVSTACFLEKQEQESEL